LQLRPFYPYRHLAPPLLASELRGGETKKDKAGQRGINGRGKEYIMIYRKTDSKQGNREKGKKGQKSFRPTKPSFDKSF
jgi:hypothetical protein